MKRATQSRRTSTRATGNGLSALQSQHPPDSDLVSQQQRLPQRRLWPDSVGPLELSSALSDSPPRLIYLLQRSQQRNPLQAVNRAQAPALTSEGGNAAWPFLRGEEAMG